VADRASVQTQIPKDRSGVPVPVLGPDPDTALTNGTVNSGSQTHAIPSGSEIVEVAVSTDTWLLFTTSGGSVSNSTGMFLPSGVISYRVPEGATHIAVIQDSTSGRISITRMV
jgi:streptogramin lyase